MTAAGMPRTPSKDAKVHRDLIVTDPPMLGADVKALKGELRERLKARGLDDDIHIGMHDKFTHATWLACVEVGYALGLASTTYLKTDKGRGVCTQGAQRIYRDPATRTNLQYERAKARQDRVQEGPRYYDELAKKVAPSTDKGPAAALAFAERNVGKTENPPGSNWGHPVQDWIKLAGYNGPVPWCGCFVNAGCVAAGVPNGRGWIGYTPAIVAHAKQGIGGWSWHTSGKPGDLALFDSGPGGDIAVHVGFVEKNLGGGRYQTIEGNTSSGDGGSQSNGGGAFRRQRSTAGGFRIIGFARPPW